MVPLVPENITAIIAGGAGGFLVLVLVGIGAYCAFSRRKQTPVEVMMLITEMRQENCYMNQITVCKLKFR